MVFNTDEIGGVFPQVLDHPKVWPHVFGIFQVLEVTGDVHHTSMPICRIIALAFELVVAEGANSFRWEGSLGEVGNGVGDPVLDI